jgi:hypothetical protein
VPGHLDGGESPLEAVGGNEDAHALRSRPCRGP